MGISARNDPAESGFECVAVSLTGKLRGRDYVACRVWCLSCVSLTKQKGFLLVSKLISSSQHLTMAA